jgi:hypothetical protein
MNKRSRDAQRSESANIARVTKRQKHKTCAHDGCESRPGFNVEGASKGLYCKTHAADGMVDVKHERCAHDGCTKLQPVFNVEGASKGLYCKTHAADGMVDVVSTRCLTPLCGTQVSNAKYDGYCLRCFMHTFPDKPVARGYRTKEAAAVEHVQSAFPGVTWTCNKQVIGGCSQRRPDMYTDVGHVVVLIEIDENQHDTYDCSCENKRTMELSRDFGHRPIVFIRFNPDEYYQRGSKVTSCWGPNKQGVTVVKKSKQAEWRTRLSALSSHVEYWMRNGTTKTVEVVQLFYDECE